MTISERIHMLIKQRKVTQTAIAEAAGVTPTTVSTWIRYNYESIPSACLVKIADALEVKVTELLFDEAFEKEYYRDPIERLKANEQRLLKLYRGLPEKEQAEIYNAAVFINREYGKGNRTKDVESQGSIPAV